MVKGLVIKLLGGNYYVQVDAQVFKCRARGKFRHLNISPVVGDFVEIDLISETEGYIINVLERKNYLYRPKMANIDYGLITMSFIEPKLSTYLVDKLIAFLEIYNVTPVLLFTKADLIDIDNYAGLIAYYQTIGYDVFVINNNDHTVDLVDIKSLLNNSTTIILGQTGVGKSSFINLLDSSLNIATNEISKALGRGKHTTRHTEIYQVGNIKIVDSPGFSSLEFKDNISKQDIANSFVEFKELGDLCKFNTCIHINEPNCNVKANLDNEFIQTRYNNYLKLMEEIFNGGYND